MEWISCVIIWPQFLSTPVSRQDLLSCVRWAPWTHALAADRLRIPPACLASPSDGGSLHVLQVILASEAAQQDAVNRAQGEASAILARAEATAKGLKNVSEAIKWVLLPMHAMSCMQPSKWS